MRQLPDNYEELLRAKLQPGRIRATLSFAGLILIVYEMVKRAVVDNVRDFYLRGFDESGLTYDDEGYARDVSSLDPRSKFRASAKWLVRHDAITSEQIEVLERLYIHRKDVAHELAKYLVDVEHEPDADLFIEALKALHDIHNFWIQIEIDTGMFEEHGDVSVDDVQPLSLGLLGVFIDACVPGLSGADEETTRSP